MGPGETFIALIGGLTIIGYIFFTARHRERMSMIDKGVSPSLFFSKEKSGIRLTLKLGMLAVGIAVGILMAMILVETFDNLRGEPIVIAMILLFGGISLITNFLIERKMDEDSKKDAE